MSEFFFNYGLFLAKSLTVLLVLLFVVAAAANAAARGRRPFDGGRIMSSTEALELAEVPGGHHVHLTHPERVAPAIRDFLES